MAKLTQVQRLVLSGAAERGDGAASEPGQLGKAAARKVGSSLVARRLLREIKSRPGVPIWREDEKGKVYSLVITSAGRAAVGVDNAEKQTSTVKSDKSEAIAPARAKAASPRGGTKQALIVEMLSQDQGTTLAALIKATGWLPHTTRAALTGLRKRGYVIERLSGSGAGPSLYRIVETAKHAA